MLVITRRASLCATVLGAAATVAFAAVMGQRAPLAVANNNQQVANTEKSKIQYDNLDLPAEITIRASAKTRYTLDLSKVPTTFSDDTVYGPIQEQKLPAQAIWTTKLSNQTSQQATQQLNVGEVSTTTDTLTITVTDGLTSTSNVAMNFKYQGIGTSFGESEGFTFTRSTAKTRTITKQRSWNYIVAVPIAPHKTVRVALILTKTKLSMTFKGTVQVQGNVIGINPLKNIVAVVVDPPPVDTLLPVGSLFREKPHPRVTVVNDDTITCSLSGIIVGVVGTDLSVVASEVDSPIPAKVLFQTSEMPRVAH